MSKDAVTTVEAPPRTGAASQPPADAGDAGYRVGTRSRGRVHAAAERAEKHEL
ncbi:hypothetical protein [Streptomyces sp. NPDC002851]